MTSGTLIFDGEVAETGEGGYPASVIDDVDWTVGIGSLTFSIAGVDGIFDCSCDPYNRIGRYFYG